MTSPAGYKIESDTGIDFVGNHDAIRSEVDLEDSGFDTTPNIEVDNFDKNDDRNIAPSVDILIQSLEQKMEDVKGELISNFITELEADFEALEKIKREHEGHSNIKFVELLTNDLPKSIINISLVRELNQTFNWRSLP